MLSAVYAEEVKLHCHGRLKQPLVAQAKEVSEVNWLMLEGNQALLSAGLLDSLIENGEPGSLQSAEIRRNPLLPESDVLPKLDLLGVQGTVCGNAGGDPECFCIVG